MALLRIFTNCWNRRCFPDDFRDTNTISPYKNNDNRSDCNNYRDVSLLCIAGKVFARLLLPKVCQIADIILPKNQYGFLPSKSTTYVVLTYIQLQEKSVEESCPLHVVFIDLTKACWAALKRYFPFL